MPFFCDSPNTLIAYTKIHVTLVTVLLLESGIHNTLKCANTEPHGVVPSFVDHERQFTCEHVIDQCLANCQKPITGLLSRYEEAVKLGEKLEEFHKTKEVVAVQVKPRRWMQKL